MVKTEPMNRHDIHAVAIYRDTKIVGHVPYNLALRMSAFLMRENKAFAEITAATVDKMKELVESLLADGHYTLCNSDFAQR